VIVGVVSLALRSIHSTRGQRPFEFVILGLLLIVAIGFVAGLFVKGVDWGAAAGGLAPRFDGGASVLLAASMLGATVMPHAIYLHSALVRDRHGHVTDPGRLRTLVVASRWDVGLSLAIAGGVNLAMLLLAAENLHGAGETDTIAGAHAAVREGLGPIAALLFAIGLLASGLASTSVGCYAGSIIMAGLLRTRVPTIVRRSVTLVPALAILAAGVDPTWALVMSQVLLSLGIPFAILPLVRATGDRVLMGAYVNGRTLRLLAWGATALVLSLNVGLVALTALGRV
jgi:manganese transport protein